MIKISIERRKIEKSLKELENEFKKGDIPKNHYEFQKRQLTEKLETLSVAERVRKLQGKETAEAPVESSDESENKELFKKYITSSGLKEKNIEGNNKISSNKMIGTALLIAAFIIGAGFGIYILNIPEQVSSVPMFTNDSAFPPYVVNNTTNTTNMTNATNSTKALNTTVNTTITKPVQQDPTPIKEPTPSTPPTKNNTTTPPTAAGDPSNHKTVQKSSDSGTTSNSKNTSGNGT
ncbi:MAG: hypothetical protein ACPK7O_03055 [Methanobacterium sp.]